MRKILLCTALTLAAMPAAASSIVSENALSNSGDSVKTLSCSSCPPEQTDEKKSYTVPQLKSGVEEAKLGDWHGQENLVRVDKFFGGSPVMTISKAQVPLMQELAAANQKIKAEKIAQAAAQQNELMRQSAANSPTNGQMSTRPPGIDATIATSAVDKTPEPARFDPASLKLRLD